MKAKPVHSDNQTSSFHSNIQLNYFYNQPGSLPGAITIAEQAKHPEIVLIDYNQNQHRYLANLNPAECAAYLNTDSVSWIDVRGLGDKSILQQLGEVFGIGLSRWEI